MSVVLLWVVIEEALCGMWSIRWWVVCGLSGESGAALSDVARRLIARRGKEYCFAQSASHNVTCCVVMLVLIHVSQSVKVTSSQHMYVVRYQ